MESTNFDNIRYIKFSTGQKSPVLYKYEYIRLLHKK